MKCMHVLDCPNWSISSMCLSCNSCIMHPVILGYTVYMMNKYITWSGQGVYYLCRYGWECHFMWCCYTITNQIHHERRLDLYNPMHINYRKKICIHIQTYTINCKQGLCLYTILHFVSSCKITVILPLVHACWFEIRFTEEVINSGNEVE